MNNEHPSTHTHSVSADKCQGVCVCVCVSPLAAGSVGAFVFATFMNNFLFFGQYLFFNIFLAIFIFPLMKLHSPIFNKQF